MTGPVPETKETVSSQPCPFCGGSRFTAELSSTPHYKHLRCEQCGRGGRWMENPEPANTREQDDFCQWLASYPAPSVQDLIAQYGTWMDVPHAAQAAFDRDLADWQTRRMDRLLRK